MTNYNTTSGMKFYDTIVQALTELKRDGYVEDFNLKQNCIECRNGQFKLFHRDFEIEGYQRFDDADSSPESEAILYLITSERYGLKGTLINSYSIYSEDISDEMLSKLQIRKAR